MSELNQSDNYEWLKVPSDYLIPEKRPKRAAGPVDFTQLDESQMRAAEGAMEYIDGNAKCAMMCITGFAGCLAGDTKINVCHRRSHVSTRSYSLKELYEKFNGNNYKRRNGNKNGQKWDASIPAKTLSYLSDKNRLGINTIVNVTYSGVKEVFLVTTEEGHTIKATADHRFLINDTNVNDQDCYKCLEHLRVGDSIYSRYYEKASGRKENKARPAFIKKMPYYPTAKTKLTKERTTGVVYEYHRITKARAAYDAGLNNVLLEEFMKEVCSNPLHDFVFSDSTKEIHHVDENIHNNTFENLKLLSKSEHAKLHSDRATTHFKGRQIKPTKIVSIIAVGKEDTYDIEMTSPYNNFLANDIVVHNCGKTFLESRLLEWIVYTKKFTVVVTAPTNKAVDVARDMSQVEDKLLSFSTLHKLLGLQESYDFNGRLTFKPDPHNPPSLDGIEVLFIDEVSMLDDTLFEYILPFVKDGLKLIFVGDPAQIPPINHIDCKPFLKKEQVKHKIQLYTLDQPHRQAEGNPILELATTIRENINNDQKQLPDTCINDSGGIVVLNKTEKEIIYKICDNYFANNYFKDYADFCKVIAWRNVTVNAINDKVRKIIYRKEVLPALMIGEKLLADSPIKDSRGYIIFSTNAEFEVVNYELCTTKVVITINNDVVFRQDVKYYQTKVIGTQPSNKKTFDKQFDIWVLHEDSAKEYKQGLQIAKAQVLRLDQYKRFDGWRSYFLAFNTFAPVKYNYAITAHKSQGSSYENCMMLDWDMNTNPRTSERNRIRYVAATRPRHYLFIVKN